MRRSDWGRLLPRVLGIGCYLTRPGSQPEGSSYPWHDHVVDEVLLVTDCATTIGHGGEEYRAEPNTIFLHRRGEKHSYWNGPNDTPRTSVVHYQPEEAFYDQCPQLADPDPRARSLAPLQCADVRAQRSLSQNVCRAPR